IIPPTKVVRRGTFNEDILGVIAANSRTPDQNLSDLKAMVGAMEMAGRRIAELVERHGVDTFLAAQSQIQDYAAAKAREVLRRIPDGEYEFWDYLDDDLVTRIPMRYRVRMVVRDGEVEVDATGTDHQTRTSYNLTTAGRDHPWFFVKLTQFILSFDRSIPLNYGIYRHLKAINPAGTVMNAEFPDPVGVRHSSYH